MLIQRAQQSGIWLRAHLRFVLLYFSAALFCALAGGWLGSLPPAAGREFMKLLALPAALLVIAIAIVAWLRRASI